MACGSTATAVPGVGGGFDAAEVQARLAAGPPATDDSIVPSRWTLVRIRQALPEVADYTLSGVWRLVVGSGLRWRRGQVPPFSPDPEYATKLATLERCLQATAAAPERMVTLFLDEMGFTRWPEPGPDWAPVAPTPPPQADRQGAPAGKWRLVGALNAWTGQVDYLDNYKVGRKQLAQFYQQVAAAYPAAERIYVVQDNWSIHAHPDVLAALALLPRIEPVWLPTYAPWLNPIEQLWRALRGTVLTQHHLAADWAALRARVQAFLDQFAHGSPTLLTTVGLTGAGRLAQWLHPV